MVEDFWMENVVGERQGYLPVPPPPPSQASMTQIVHTPAVFHTLTVERVELLPGSKHNLKIYRIFLNYKRALVVTDPKFNKKNTKTDIERKIICLTMIRERVRDREKYDI